MELTEFVGQYPPFGPNPPRPGAPDAADAYRQVSADEGLDVLPACRGDLPGVTRPGHRDGMHLWVIVPSEVRVLLETAPHVHPPPLSLGVAKHTNLTGGAPACCGGELWIDAVDPNRIWAHGGSGRYTAKSPRHLEDAISVIESMGFVVTSAGWDVENARPARVFR